MTNLSRQQQDLGWCIHQPPLVQGEIDFPDQSWFAAQEIAHGTAVPIPPDRFRLGIHFEKVYQAWLQQHSHYQLVAANLQVQGSERTIGEFDLLVNVAGEIEHWELAVKFYINCHSPQDPGHWFGPDPKDTLKSKLDRLLNHQLKMGQDEDAIKLLARKNLSIRRTRGIIKGRLYHPWQHFQDGIDLSALANCINPHHLKGWWLASDDWQTLATANVVYLDKRYWLAAVSKEDDLPILSAIELERFLSTTNQIAPQFALLDEFGDEVSRGFVLKPAWFAAVAGYTEAEKTD